MRYLALVFLTTEKKTEKNSNYAFAAARGDAIPHATGAETYRDSAHQPEAQARRYASLLALRVSVGAGRVRYRWPASLLLTTQNAGRGYRRNLPSARQFAVKHRHDGACVK